MDGHGSFRFSKVVRSQASKPPSHFISKSRFAKDLLFLFLRLGHVQLIVELPLDAEEYVSQSFQRRVVAPAECPHCHVRTSLETLGYYHRNVTGNKSTVLQISGSV